MLKPQNKMIEKMTKPKNKYILYEKTSILTFLFLSFPISFCIILTCAFNYWDDYVIQNHDPQTLNNLFSCLIIVSFPYPAKSSPTYITFPFATDLIS